MSDHPSYRAYRRCDVVVTNLQRSTAIVFRNDEHKVTSVPMKGGKLSTRTVSFPEFRNEWRETGYSLSLALTTFLSHIMKWDASLEAKKGLARLAARDRFVVASLFYVAVKVGAGKAALLRQIRISARGIFAA